ncbi:MAG: primosomal protein N' [Alicyclobacillaceae bacterium]|nr:primosomal protein N' [Alicyclobacillaceae bacterium]
MAVEVITELRVRSADRTFTYAVPSDLVDRARPGARVLVPFGRRYAMGLIVGPGDPGVPELREILDVIDEIPAVPEDLLSLADWLSRRYVCTRSEAVRAVLPPGAFGRMGRYIEIGSAVREEDPSISGPAGKLVRLLLQGPLSRDRALDVLGGDVRLLRTGLRKGWWRERVEARAGGEKKIRTAIPLADREGLKRAIEALWKRAPKQSALLEWFLRAGPGPAPVSDLLRETGASAGALHALVQKGLLRIEERGVRRDPFGGRKWDAAPAPELTEEQRRALEMIEERMDAGGDRPVLLYGVTGSGKTEVYMRAIESAVNRGRQAIVLVPEISLTPQMVARFKGRFGDRVAVLHSRLSLGERHDEWMRLRRGEAWIAVGARSAVFAPVERLGLIVVDEEHEGSYKQEEAPKYAAREVAQERARRHGAAVVFGSATPSLEVIHLVRQGRAHLVPLRQRVGGRPLPRAQVVDMRRELAEGNRSMFSRLLQRELRTRLARGEQAVILMNRRGYSTFVLCRACGHVMQCPHCDLSLTYHRIGHVLRCHYCGYATRAVEECPACRSPYIRHFGTGTQRVEEELNRLFPEARVIRVDVDTTRRKGAHEELLDRFAQGAGNVLLGTQMIAKGLDFPRVGLVGVISADTSLYLPDFRAAERTYQLLVQVAGRAGRGEVPGTIVIQTYNPEHYAVRAAAEYRPGPFYRRELAAREAGGYPPFSELAVWRVQHPEPEGAAAVAARVEARLREVLPPEGVTVLPAAPSPLARLQGLYRYQVVVKYADWERVCEGFRTVWQEAAAGAGPEGSVQVDVAAQTLM